MGLEGKSAGPCREACRGREGHSQAQRAQEQESNTDHHCPKEVGAALPGAEVANKSVLSQTRKSIKDIGLITDSLDEAMILVSRCSFAMSGSRDRPGISNHTSPALK